MNILAPYDAGTVLYGHIHRPHHATMGTAQHHAARSLIFAFPDPATTAEKKPIPFDKSQPFRNLGIREVEGNGARRTLSFNDVELTTREMSGTEGSQRLPNQRQTKRRNTHSHPTRPHP